MRGTRCCWNPRPGSWCPVYAGAATCRVAARSRCRLESMIKRLGGPSRSTVGQIEGQRSLNSSLYWGFTLPDKDEVPGSNSPRCSDTIRTARSRTSGEYIVGLPILHYLPTNRVSGKPGGGGSSRRLLHQRQSSWKRAAASNTVVSFAKEQTLRTGQMRLSWNNRPLLEAI